MARVVVLVLLAAGAAAQLVPYGRDHTNPPVVADAPWPTGASAAAARAACYDCHSSETRWPWWSKVAPASWLVTSDVAGGRLALDFSRWPRDEHQVGDAVDAVEERSMPPRPYLLMHPEARLSSAERQALLEGLRAMEQQERRRGRGRGRGGR